LGCWSKIIGGKKILFVVSKMLGIMALRSLRLLITDYRLPIIDRGIYD